MQEYRRGAVNALYLILVQGANYVVPLAVMFHFMKELGIAGFGQYAFWYSVMLYVQTFVDYGFSFSGTRDIAASDGSSAKISAIFSQVTVAKLLLSACVLTLALTYYFFMADSAQPVLVVAATGMLTALIPNWYFQGIQQLREISLFNVLGRVVFLVLAFSLIDSTSQVSDIFLLHFVAVFPPLIFGYWFIYKRIRWSLMISKQDLAKQYSAGWHIFSTTMLSMLLSNGGVFWLGLSTSPAIVGIYAAVERVVKAIVGLFIPISQAFYPLNSRMFSQSFEKGLRSVGVTGVAMLSLCAMAIAVFYFSSSIWFEIFKIPAEGTAYLGVLLTWVFFSVFNNVAGIQTLSASGAAARYAYSFNIAAVIFVLVIYLQMSTDAGKVVAQALLTSEIALSVLLVLNILHIIVVKRRCA
ncbi:MULTISPECIES: oligosaccharide flippase family protein [Pseudomonas]|uniref:Oligosaccharide flippase family protein n=1 Tax=Pseudomonas donghuensis TaxID=1163398 RepID=A0AAP0SG63_9PSED|nr:MULTISPECIES: oligosaccharide flippase family protein [Pseudomonas]KDN97865.2 oligosaccharide flippase family protein [Pseudomonas donghuensis]MCP6693069.1 oligosaccharide flippase family protein [Pseudomonas donghuensis]MDF9894748.1 PST family polysaccharide transporter [Pseudomonas vranovensis]QHF29751.1 hypothetical protein PspR32_18880 [Pseudomonas sp. R32]